MKLWHRVFRIRDKDEELEKELRFHLEEHTSDLIAQGYSPEEARRRARIALGGPEQVKEMCRDIRPTRWLRDLLQDVRFSLRMMRKAPGFTAVAVLALALGIGVNTAALSIVNGAVLRPLPVENPNELITPHWGRKSDAHVWGEFSYPNYLDLRDQNKSFSDLCAWRKTSSAISFGESRTANDDKSATVLWGELVTSNYFEVMGAKPILGRGFLPEENRTPNSHPVVVISQRVWEEHFNADEGVLGKTVFLNGQQFTVIGVMPESFLGAEYYQRHAFWVPAMMGQRFGRRADWNTDRNSTLFKLYGRLKPALTMTQAEIDLNQVLGALAERYPRENAGTKIQLTTELDGRHEAATKIFQYGGLLALCISALVLLLACANVTNLMLARAASRAREIGTRFAIGAGRGRIVRQMLTESVLLALLGGALGWAFAYWGTDVIRGSVPPGPYPIHLDISPDRYVLKWMLLVSSITGVIFGLVPALFASRTDLVAVIKGATGQSRRQRRWNLRSTLVVAQVTISIMVLICAGLFVRSLRKVFETDPGFKTETMVTMMINPRLLGYDQKAIWRFFPELLRRIETQPGVRMAALTDDLPLQNRGSLSRGPIVREGEADPQPNQGVISKCNYVSPKYFDTVQTPLVVGRDFTARDDADAPRVVIVNQEFARRFYGGAEKAIGKRFRFEAGTPHIGNYWHCQRRALWQFVRRPPTAHVSASLSAATRQREFGNQRAIDGRSSSSRDQRASRDCADGCAAASGWLDGGRREHVVTVLGAASGGGNGFDVWLAGVGAGDDGIVQRDDVCSQSTHS
jgi:predicted permease